MDEAALILDEDVPCDVCKYNLRGLPTYATCPECGNAYDVSTEHAWIDPALRALARRIGWPVDAMLFVQACVREAVLSRRRATAEAPAILHATAADVCHAFRKLVLRDFADEQDARLLLSGWKLTTSEAVGSVVFGLVAAGAMLASDGDSPADFKGLFQLADLFVRPHPRLDPPPPPA